MYPVELPNMFPAEEIQPISSSVRIDLFDDILIPVFHSARSVETNYSPKQIRVQNWIEENPRKIRRFALTQPIHVVIPTALAVAFVAYGTGGRSWSHTPEIQDYDESAFASGIGNFTVI